MVNYIVQMMVGVETPVNTMLGELNMTTGLRFVHFQPKRIQFNKVPQDRSRRSQNRQAARVIIIFQLYVPPERYF